MSQTKLFKYRHFGADIILLCVRWYLRYSLSYRDLEEMMVERGLTDDGGARPYGGPYNHIDHTTI